MQCVRQFIVQDAESLCFLAPDGEGGVVLVRMFGKAVPFADEEAAECALVDHLDGLGVVYPVWVPAADFACERAGG